MRGQDFLDEGTVFFGGGDAIFWMSGVDFFRRGTNIFSDE